MSEAGPRIRRAFVALDDAEIHYRHAGTRADGPADGAVGSDGRPLPLVLVHASPASSLGLVPLIRAFATDRHVVAPDTVGNGDSTGEIPDGAPIAWFAQRLADALERIGLARYDLYGTHTGASLATELALRHPGRVGALVLDGVGLYPPDFQRELLERYAPEIRPDPHGGPSRGPGTSCATPTSSGRGTASTASTGAASACPRPRCSTRRWSRC